MGKTILFQESVLSVPFPITNRLVWFVRSVELNKQIERTSWWAKWRNRPSDLKVHCHFLLPSSGYILYCIQTKMLVFSNVRCNLSKPPQAVCVKKLWQQLVIDRKNMAASVELPVLCRYREEILSSGGEVRLDNFTPMRTYLWMKTLIWGHKLLKTLHSVPLRLGSRYGSEATRLLMCVAADSGVRFQNSDWLCKQ